MRDTGAVSEVAFDNPYVGTIFLCVVFSSWVEAVEMPCLKVWMEEDRPPSWSGCPRKARHCAVRELCEEAQGLILETDLLRLANSQGCSGKQCLQPRGLWSQVTGVTMSTPSPRAEAPAFRECGSKGLSH